LWKLEVYDLSKRDYLQSLVEENDEDDVYLVITTQLMQTQAQSISLKLSPLPFHCRPH